jgi:hypothetical protein
MPNAARANEALWDLPKEGGQVAVLHHATTVSQDFEGDKERNAVLRPAFFPFVTTSCGIFFRLWVLPGAARRA